MLRQSFLHGALTLAVAGAMSRILGVFYVAVLPRVLHGEGYGLYTAVKPVYHAVMVVAVAGLPVAIAKMVADRLAVGDTREVWRVFRVSLLATAFTGLLAALALATGAKYFAELALRMPAAAPALLALAPAALLCTLASALRGFFQGLQQMTPSAVSQVAEQGARVIGTVGFALLLAPLGSVYGAAGALAGSVVGGAAALLTLCGYYLARRRKIHAELRQKARPQRHINRRDTLRRMAELAFPVVLGQILWPVFELIDTMMIPAGLQRIGYSQSAALAWLGYFGMAGQLMWFPTVLTLAFSASLVPAIAEAWAQGNLRLVHKRLGDAMRVAMLFALPAAVGLYLLSDQCAWLLFGYVEAGKPLAILAFGTLVIGLQQLTSGALQGLGKMALPVRNLLAGAACKLACNLWLTDVPQLGVCGAAYGTLAGFALAALLNLRDIRLRTGASTQLLSQAPKFIGATAIMAIGVRLTYDGLFILGESLAEHGGLSPFTINAAATVGAIGAGCLVYFAALVRLGGIQRADIESIPKLGKRCAGMLGRRGWWR